MARSAWLTSSHSRSVGVEAYLDIENNFRSAQVLASPRPYEGCHSCSPMQDSF